MIELSPIETETFTNSFDAAKLYCFSLNVDGKIGWRLPTQEEYYGNKYIYGSWYVGRPTANIVWYVTPVRDLKDD
jgi:hypothetical protein